MPKAPAVRLTLSAFLIVVLLAAPVAKIESRLGFAAGFLLGFLLSATPIAMPDPTE
jgi:hypothetical protein